MSSCLSRKATDPTRKATTVTIQERVFNLPRIADSLFSDKKTPAMNDRLCSACNSVGLAKKLITAAAAMRTMTLFPNLRRNNWYTLNIT